jgi:formylglycine-generating enzyme required for sulfatase activity
MYLMGDAFEEGYPSDGETPRHAVTLSPFSIDRAPVTVAQFAAFVSATHYRTTAERAGYSAVFSPVEDEDSTLRAGPRPTLGRPQRTPWWSWVAGADWSHPSGPGSSVEGRDRHPVTHVSFRDAASYCIWSGRRLPTEAEWEFAARGGLSGARYPWGDELEPGGVRQCNIWVGEFPRRDDTRSGHGATSRVGSFPPNGYGLLDMAGNVWEWCLDWFSADTYAARHEPGPSDGSRDPHGPHKGTERVIRGGSHLCHSSYCNRYRVAARSRSDPAASCGNLGFRTVAVAQDT